MAEDWTNEQISLKNLDMERLSKKELVRENILFNSGRFNEQEERKYEKEFPSQVLLHLAENLDCECLNSLLSKHKKTKTKPGRICIQDILKLCKNKRELMEHYVRGLSREHQDMCIKEKFAKDSKKEYDFVLSYLDLQENQKELHDWLNQSVKHIYTEAHIEDKNDLISTYSNYPYFEKLVKK